MPAHNAAAPAGGQIGVNIAPPIMVSGPGPAKLPGNANQTASGSTKSVSETSDPKRIALPGAAEIAARSKALAEKKTEEAKEAKEAAKAAQETPESSAEEASKGEDQAETKDASADPTAPKEPSISFAHDVVKQHPGIEHLSAPPSAFQSGTVTPANTPATTTTASEDVAEPAEKPETKVATAAVDAEPPHVKIAGEDSTESTSEDSSVEAAEQATPAKVSSPAAKGAGTEAIATEDGAPAKPAGEDVETTTEAKAPVAIETAKKEEEAKESPKTATKEEPKAAAKEESEEESEEESDEESEEESDEEESEDQSEKTKSKAAEPAKAEKKETPAVASATKGVEGLSVENEPKSETKTQEQSAKEEADASKSVED